MLLIDPFTSTAQKPIVAGAKLQGLFDPTLHYHSSHFAPLGLNFCLAQACTNRGVDFCKHFNCRCVLFLA